MKPRTLRKLKTIISSIVILAVCAGTPTAHALPVTGVEVTGAIPIIGLGIWEATLFGLGTAAFAASNADGKKVRDPMDGGVIGGRFTNSVHAIAPAEDGPKGSAITTDVVTSSVTPPIGTVDINFPVRNPGTADGWFYAGRGVGAAGMNHDVRTAFDAGRTDILLSALGFGEWAPWEVVTTLGSKYDS